MRTSVRGARALLVSIMAAALWLAPRGPVPAAVASPQDPALVSKINKVMADQRVTRARSAAAVIDARDGTELYARYGSRATTPASNTKLITAVAAMDTLGPRYRFKTEAIRRGRIVDGVVQGRLYLKGYGDPTTRVSDYAKLAAQIRAKGITRFTGRLAVDASYFDTQRYNPHWSTSYASDYYAAQTAALTVAPNADLDSGTIFLKYRPGRRGAPAKISTSPAAAAGYVRIVNRSTTSASGSDTIRIRRSWGTNTITITGRVPSGRAERSRLITVDRPELLAAAVLRDELRKRGVTVAGKTILVTTPSTSRKVIASDTSMELADLLKPFLKLSNNMHAEALTKAMSARAGGPGSWSDGLTHIRSYLRRLGTPMSGVVLVDGSGLTRVNKLTPRAVNHVLWKVRSEPWFADFYTALPVAGVTNRAVGGTLRYRMNGTRAANNAHAKTGTLTGVTALSGYVRGRNGRLYAFSMLSQYSGSSPRPVENTFVVTLANWNG